MKTTILPQQREMTERGGWPRQLLRLTMAIALAFGLGVSGARAQDDQLNQVHVQPKGAPNSPTAEPTGAEAAPATGKDALKLHPGSFIRMNVDMVLVPGKSSPAFASPNGSDVRSDGHATRPEPTARRSGSGGP